MRLYYFHDPMCSWCWAFRPALGQIEAALPVGIRLVRVLGGLAPDTDAPMPADLQRRIQAIWQTIQHRVPGTAFNYAFWTDCAPRRATYRACRAVIAASQQGDYERAMIEAIQRAYYLEARNPSDRSTLLALSADLGLDIPRFAMELDHPETQRALDGQIQLARALGVQGFPTLLLEAGGGAFRPIAIDYNEPAAMLEQLALASQCGDAGRG